MKTEKPQTQSPKLNETTWKRFYSIARPEQKTLLWGLFFLVLSSGAGLIYPQLVRWMVDHVLQPKNFDLLTKVVLVLLVAFVVQAITGSLRYYLFTLSGERIVLRLRQRLYEHILKQEISFFDFNRTGELMSRLASDCTTLQNTVSVNVSQGLRNLGQVIGGFAFMFYTSWKLSAMMLILIPPVALSAFLFGKRIRKYSKDFQSTLADASIVAEETISGVRTVKSFVQEITETHRYRKSLDIALLTAQKKIRSIGEFMTLAMVMGFTAVCFVLWYGGREVVMDKMTIGDLTQFLLYLMIVAIGVGSLGSLWGDIMAGVGASQRVFEILEKETIATETGAIIQPFAGQIEFRNVSFSYPTRTDTPVLKNLNFKIKPGQIIALVGSSGGGKTTVSSLIPRFYDPTDGDILIDGISLQKLKLSWLRDQIGIVSQEPILISSTIEDNIKYARPTASHDDVIAAAKSANAFEFIQNFPEGFRTQVGERGIQLSGGQKQRVAIARALLKNPKILILDEATSNLDTASEHLVQEALQRLMQGRTTLVIAHRLATIKDADQIFVIDHGELVQQGTHDQLTKITDGIYFQLLQRQFISQT
ncbi:MAG: ABC transporter permease [Bdellovibrionales bacterium RIFCSPHIGHO2_01_FULL_40_29]|nr:MAG: ABC transporter permease [Bdellovibrionales bacterium RIFCSPHIGHO2_01_FULL_40_29]OFZ34436.1 MAG: ABC transporter permease [Bdellovibrionales bacterium RIFCSPHIGHO2_02_FULL_40_15]